ncbi:alpha/beta hydrolase [Adhaeribacter arboris]|uniref:Alpha/beta hydrolase n=1 Tax=Adhaeribacter arboris TaxID=2072846 RepID=A0A2T2YAJ4_9BACT|nr:alpha/beta fold hydrolase [Adhaeribacter arboris]PSR52524.1 alpha/beta hydrolase [Adhaeribacter arboris]
MNNSKLILILISLIILVYFGIYGFLQSIKEEQGNIFKSQKLPADFKYSLNSNFEELNFPSKNGGLLNSLLFRVDHSKGVICFWKGNGGTLKNWGEIAPHFLKLNYDIFITDYRQHGKSQGSISLENFYSDAQTVYDALKKRYPENKIVITGYSLGGRIAAHLAASNLPRLTILIDAASTTGDFSERFFEAMYYPLPLTNNFLFQTETDIRKAKSPVVIIATENPNSLSHQLKPLRQNKGTFFQIKGATHETILTHNTTAKIIAKVLK